MDILLDLGKRKKAELEANDALKTSCWQAEETSSFTSYTTPATVPAPYDTWDLPVASCEFSDSWPLDPIWHFEETFTEESLSSSSALLSQPTTFPERPVTPSHAWDLPEASNYLTIPEYAPVEESLEAPS
ncbi:hypothetical protein H0H93_013550, partial [Arthromyces matolae]